MQCTLYKKTVKEGICIVHISNMCTETQIFLLVSYFLPQDTTKNTQSFN